MAPADRQTRHDVALPPFDERARLRAEEQGWDLASFDRDDPDERSILIRLAHPELDDAVADGAETVVVGGEEVKPRLHFVMHEIVAAQIIDGDPPEAFETAQRLLAGGRDHHEVLHMIGFVASGQMWEALHDQREYRRDEYVSELAALPASFDAAWAPAPAPAPNRAERRAAARRARRSRRF